MPALWRRYSGQTVIRALNFFTAFGLFFEGYNQGVMAGVNGSADYISTVDVGENGVVTNNTKLGGIVAVYYFGVLFGCFWGGHLGDKLGRKRGVFLGTLWALLGAALQSSAQNDNWMICGRVIAGIGTGHLVNIVPVWSAEVAQSHSRGRFVCFVFLANYIGITVAYWLAFGLSFSDNHQVIWRFPLAFQCIPALILNIVIWFLPESPRWLVKKGHSEEAKEILTKIREGAGVGHSPEEVQTEYEEILRVVELETTFSARNSIFAMPFGYKSGKAHFARRTWLAFGIQIMMEWGGITAVVVYSPVIFAQAGYGPTKASWISALNNTFGILGTFMSAFLIDRFGRRKLLFFGSAGCSISMFLGGAFSKLVVDNPDKAEQYGAAATLFLFLFTLCFSTTWLMVTWIYPTEIFPTEVRAKGNSFAVAGFAVGCGWTTLVNPVMFGNITYNTFWIFGCVNLLYIPIVYCFYPETARRPLEAMEFLFHSDSPLAWNEEKEFENLVRLHGGHFARADMADVVGEKIHIDSEEFSGTDVPRSAGV